MNDATRLIEKLQRAEAFDHPIQQFELLETHISWVLLTGPAAYKIKKPVNLGFVDFTTLALRRHFCLEELRLNRRLAPDLYLAVRPILGPADAPTIGHALAATDGSDPPVDGEILEYAVQMRQFAHEQLAPVALAQGQLKPRHWDRLAADVARFHASVDRAAADSPLGRPEVAARFMLENFDQLADGTTDADLAATIEELRRWTESRLADLSWVITRRQAKGFVRECHGDMHLGNMVLLDDALVVFDCIDFNEQLRWIDVLSEIAFTVMDLEDRGQAAAAYRFLNHYLEQTGDYADLTLLPLFMAYRAMVRAKVAFLRGQQSDVEPDQFQRLRHECREYVQQAQRYAAPRSPHLVLMHGLSGSGKTTWSSRLVEAAGAIRLRSDVERKRLYGLWPEDRAGQGRPAVSPVILYSGQASHQTYQRLLELAESILSGGFTVIVDATFLRRSHRQPFLKLAARLGVPITIAECTAPLEELRRRVAQRAAAGRDASDADTQVLESQLRQIEPFNAEEQAMTVTLAPNDQGWDALCRRVCGRLS